MGNEGILKGLCTAAARGFQRQMTVAFASSNRSWILIRPLVNKQAALHMGPLQYCWAVHQALVHFAKLRTILLYSVVKEKNLYMVGRRAD